MNKCTVDKIERISIDLLKLKPIHDLRDVYEFYKKKMEHFFDKEGQPRLEYFESVPCPVCGSPAFIHRVTIDNFIYNECAQCQTVYNNPRLKDQVVEEMYTSGEYTIYFEKLVVQKQNIRKNIIDERKFEQIDSFFEKSGKILDVGCGTGSFLKVCQEHGWEVYGIDPSNSATEVARKLYGINITQSTFENYYSDATFDCVTFWGLEHLSNPMEGVKKALAYLRPGGLIVFESPSADSFLLKYIRKYEFDAYRYIESARHILFFSRCSIDFICSRYNLELAYLESNGLDIQTILLHEFDNTVRSKLINIQRVIDECNLGDHYRVFLKKPL